MLAALLLHPAQWVLSFLVLDLVFRTVDVRPGILERSLGRHRRRYRLAALAATLAGGVAQVLLAGPWGLVPAAAGWVPWWLLWRFGWRKQFPHLRA
ncbi:hypothetical protein J2Z79_003127 [Symbiobacterium terraclitae]|uniref:Uncharacterized protein n=1 Tax=Symbiobacterium terraclitae TaxID=557451 RepID=A0ABS4JVX8_9FIRM|nr:hypothetical protein [Symbiobacterium terraclitae]MBP2019685.1 hypothetical protein [Symbiobacterium terraclitae]